MARFRTFTSFGCAGFHQHHSPAFGLFAGCWNEVVDRTHCGAIPHVVVPPITVASPSRIGDEVLLT